MKKLMIVAIALIAIGVAGCGKSRPENPIVQEQAQKKFETLRMDAHYTGHLIFDSEENVRKMSITFSQVKPQLNVQVSEISIEGMDSQYLMAQVTKWDTEKSGELELTIYYDGRSIYILTGHTYQNGFSGEIKGSELRTVESEKASGKVDEQGQSIMEKVSSRAVFSASGAFNVRLTKQELKRLELLVLRENIMQQLQSNGEKRTELNAQVDSGTVDSETISAIQSEIAALDSEIAALDSTIAAVGSAGADLSPLSSDVAPLSSDVAPHSGK